MMRDLHDDHVRKQMLDLTDGRQDHYPAVGSAMPQGSSQMPADGDTPGRGVVHAGDGNGRQRRDEGQETGMGKASIGTHKFVHRDGATLTMAIEDLWRGSSAALSACLDAAAAVMAADPWSTRPLASDQPWAEGDEALKARLLKYGVYNEQELAQNVPSNVLTAAAARHGVVRARLVPRP